MMAQAMRAILLASATAATLVGRRSINRPSHGRLSNHWITLHEVGNVSGFTPLLVMDVWEHAFLLDYKPAERPKYIEAFFANVDWAAVEMRLASAPREAIRQRAAG